MKALISFLAAHGLCAVFFISLAARIGSPVPAAPLLVNSAAGLAIPPEKAPVSG